VLGSTSLRRCTGRDKLGVLRPTATKDLGSVSPLAREIKFFALDHALHVTCPVDVLKRCDEAFKPSASRDRPLILSKEACNSQQ
jgi:hypothetical protein